eukprot:scaffold7335_cov289-Pinguiococcus_pyrenoidosus.AAC.8
MSTESTSLHKTCPRQRPDPRDRPPDDILDGQETPDARVDGDLRTVAQYIHALLVHFVDGASSVGLQHLSDEAQRLVLAEVSSTRQRSVPFKNVAILIYTDALVSRGCDHSLDEQISPVLDAALGACGQEALQLLRRLEEDDITLARHVAQRTLVHQQDVPFRKRWRHRSGRDHVERQQLPPGQRQRKRCGRQCDR